MLNYSIKSNLSEVRELANVLRGFCDEQKLNETLSGQLELILVEAVNNVIEHAYQNKEGFPIDITVKVNSTEIILIIKDQGIPPPSKVYDTDGYMPDFSELPEGGWGVALIQTLADQIKYFRDKDGNNTLTIKKGIS